MNSKHTILLVFLLFFVSFGYAGESLVVGIKQSPPFVIKSVDGQWSGIAVDLVKQIASNENWELKFVQYPTVDTLIKATSKGEVDIAVGAITVTSEREKLVDFTRDFNTTSIGVMTRTTSNNLVWWMVIRVGIAIIVLIITLYAIGWIADVVDGDKMIKTPHDGAWWALVTFTTTGYGDLVPTTPRGKVFAAIWMIVSMFLASVFTGYIASAMTIKRLSDHREFNPLTDTVAVLEQSVGHHYAQTHELKYVTVNNMEQGIRLLLESKVDGVLNDVPILQHYAARRAGEFEIVQLTNVGFYAFAVPTSFKLKEQLNYRMLELLSSNWWQIVTSKYLKESGGKE